jgi:hypothetical protein
VTVATDDGIRAIVTRLARPRTGGGQNRGALDHMAAGSDSAAIEAWILDHTGEAEQAIAPVAGGLHTRRLAAPSTSPRRYLLPGGILDGTTTPEPTSAAR